MEFFNLGAHCEHSHCNQKDFLPFKCNLCEKKFCKNHSTYEAHQCSKSNEFFRETVIPVCSKCNTPIAKNFPTESEEIAIKRHEAECSKIKVKKSKPENLCRHKKCRLEGIVHCKGCGSSFCLEHRFEDDHSCKRTYTQATTSITGLIHKQKAVKQLLAMRETQNEVEHKYSLKRFFFVKREAGDEFKFTNSSSNAVCPDYRPNMADDEKVFLKLFFPTASEAQPVHVYFSKYWSIGKVIDTITSVAQSSELQNRNHQLPHDSPMRLHLYLLYTNSDKSSSHLSIIPKHLTLEQLIKDGTLINGDFVILERGKEGEPLSSEATSKLTQLLTKKIKSDTILKRFAVALGCAQESLTSSSSKSTHSKVCVNV